MTRKVPRRKCANHHCERHVHGHLAARGVRHCRTCVAEFRYAFRVARERDVGTEVGLALAAFFVPRETPNNLGASAP